MPLYFYDGPVKCFEHIVNEHWKGSTYAKSEKKARSNLSHQYKRETHRSVSSKITLPGKLVVIEDKQKEAR